MCFCFMLTSLGAEPKLTIRGSDTLGAKMVPQLSEVYKELGNNIDFEIAAEGSSSCFKALLDGTAEIGMSSRSVTAEELRKFQQEGLNIVEHVVARDMICVIAHSSNSVDGLTLEHVEKIFTGEIANWKEIGGRDVKIVVYTRNETSGTFKTFQKLAMSKKDYAASVSRTPGSVQVVELVKNQADGISYCGLAYIAAEGIKPFRIDGIKPSANDKGKYPIQRNLFYYTIGKPKGAAKDFIDWCEESEEAAKVIRKVGFLPPLKE